jgi:Sigma-70, region 4
MHDIYSQGSSEVDWNALAPVLEDAIDRLGENDRAAILLRFTERRSFPEIGVVLRLTEDAARKRVDRALDKLRAFLARRGLVSSSTALGFALASHTVVAAPPGLAALVAGTATAAAAASGPAAFGFLYLMSTTKFVAVAAVALVFAIGTSSYQVFALQRAEAAHQTLNANYAALFAERRDSERRAQLAADEVGRLNKAFQEERAAQEAEAAQIRRAAAEANAAKDAAAWDPVAQGDAFMARHPEVKQALLDRTRASLNFRYGPLFKTLELNPAQMEQLQALQLEMSGAFGPPLGENGEVLLLRSGMGVKSDEVTRVLRAILGEEGFRKYVDYERLSSGRMFTEQIAGALSFTDRPLTTSQADELTKVIASSQTAKNASQARRFDWDAIMAKAGGILEPSQLTALDGMRAQDEFQQAFNGFRASQAAPAASERNATAK